MDWIACSQRMPKRPHTEVEVTDGYEIKTTSTKTLEDEETFFSCSSWESKRFFPLWWRPIGDSYLEKNFDKETYPPINYFEPQTCPRCQKTFTGGAAHTCIRKAKKIKEEAE